MLNISTKEHRRNVIFPTTFHMLSRRWSVSCAQVHSQWGIGSPSAAHKHIKTLGTRPLRNSFEIFRYSQEPKNNSCKQSEFGLQQNVVIESGCVAIPSRRWRYSILFAFEPRFFLHRLHHSSGGRDRKFSMSIRVLVLSIRFSFKYWNSQKIAKHFVRLMLRFRSVSVMK